MIFGDIFEPWGISRGVMKLIHCKKKIKNFHESETKKENEFPRSPASNQPRRSVLTSNFSHVLISCFGLFWSFFGQIKRKREHKSPLLELSALSQLIELWLTWREMDGLLA